MTLQRVFRVGRSALPLMALALTFAAANCLAQQERYVGRYDVYAGFSNISAPFVNNLNQSGFGIQGGVANNRWLTTGVDYSIQSGTVGLTANLLTPTLQQELGAMLPSGYTLNLSTDIKIWTLTGGPQLVYRRFAAVPIFVRPVLTAMRVVGTPHPADPVATAVSDFLAPSGKVTDLTGGYGIGGGADLRITKHLSTRVMLDAAWCHPMNDILGNGGWIYRFEVGPALHFGHNVTSRMR